jgi:hypothetical protein
MAGMRSWCALLTLVAFLASPAPAFAQTAAPPDPDDDDLTLRLQEPDFALVNLPTSMRLPRRSFNFRLTHRFLRNLRQGGFTSHLDNFFGLDNGAIIGLELRYAPVRKLQTIVFRTNLDKTIQFTAQYDAIRQGEKGLPVSLTGIVAIEGTNNFKSGNDDDDEGGDGHDHSAAEGHRSPSIGGIVSRSFGDRLAVYAMPMYVHHTLAVEDTHRNTFFVGLGGRLRLSRNVYVVGEVSPRAAGYQPGDPEFGFGIERRAGGHMFQLTFSNSFSGTFGQIARGGFPDTIYLGFNMSRKFF